MFTGRGAEGGVVCKVFAVVNISARDAIHIFQRRRYSELAHINDIKYMAVSRAGSRKSVGKPEGTDDGGRYIDGRMLARKGGWLIMGIGGL